MPDTCSPFLSLCSFFITGRDLGRVKSLTQLLTKFPSLSIPCLFNFLTLDSLDSLTSSGPQSLLLVIIVLLILRSLSLHSNTSIGCLISRDLARTSLLNNQAWSLMSLEQDRPRQGHYPILPPVVQSPARDRSSLIAAMNLSDTKIDETDPSTGTLPRSSPAPGTAQCTLLRHTLPVLGL